MYFRQRLRFLSKYSLSIRKFVNLAFATHKATSEDRSVAYAHILSKNKNVFLVTSYKVHISISVSLPCETFLAEFSLTAHRVYFAGNVIRQDVLVLTMIFTVAKHVIIRHPFLCWIADAISANWSIRHFISNFFVDLEATLMFDSSGVRVYFPLINILKGGRNVTPFKCYFYITCTLTHLSLLIVEEFYIVKKSFKLDVIVT